MRERERRDPNEWALGGWLNFCYINSDINKKFKEEEVEKERIKI